jgi:osmoprotectant transport system substrate-binding protein
LRTTTSYRRLHWLVAVFAVFTLLAAACGDDDDDGGTAATDGGGEQPEFDFVALDTGGPTTRQALERGDIDIALLFTTDVAIEDNDWVQLEDDKELQPAENFIPAIREDATNDDVEAVLNAVSEKIDQDAILEMIRSVSAEGQNPDDVAQKFLEDNDLPGDLKATGDITVGGANFNESLIAAELYAGALEKAGMTVKRQLDIGAREVYYPALEKGDLDVIPEFVGTLLTFLKGEPTNDLDATVDDLRTATEKDGITVLEPAEADSANTFVVTQETADKYDLTTISDLADVDESLTLGGPQECPDRPFCLLGLEDTYGLKFSQ